MRSQRARPGLPLAILLPLFSIFGALFSAGCDNGGVSAPEELSLPSGCPGCNVWRAWASTPDDVWLAGWGDAGPAMLHVLDGRREWVPLPANSSLSYEHLWGSGPSDVWAMSGFAGAEAELLHWDGSSWQIALDLDIADYNLWVLADLWGSGPNEAWIVGHRNLLPGDPAEPVVFRWDGSSWAEQSLPFPPAVALASVWTRGDGIVWMGAVACPDFDCRSVVFRWDGSSLVELATPLTPSTDPVMRGTDSEVLLLADSFPHVAYRRSGEEWLPIGPPAVGTDLWSTLDFASVTSEGDIWMIGLISPEVSDLSHLRGGSWSGVRIERQYQGLSATSSVVWLAGGEVVGRLRP